MDILELVARGIETNDADERARCITQVRELIGDEKLSDVLMRWIPIQEKYSMAQFLRVLARKLRRTHAWKVDYCTASHAEGCQVVTPMTVKKWQDKNLVPDWAVMQIDRMIFTKRKMDVKVYTVPVGRGRKSAGV